MKLPLGAIVYWPFSSTPVPTDYSISDGTNGTLDLRGQYIIGAGDQYNPFDTGGTPDPLVPIHTHDASTQGLTYSNVVGVYSTTGGLYLVEQGHEHYLSASFSAVTVPYIEGFAGGVTGGPYTSTGPITHDHNGSAVYGPMSGTNEFSGGIWLYNDGAENMVHEISGFLGEPTLFRPVGFEDSVDTKLAPSMAMYAIERTSIS